MIVDSQVHLWRAEAPDRPWPAWGREMVHLADPLTFERMIALMDGGGVDRAIIVPPSWEGDRNDYALEAVRLYPDRFRVFGRVALDDPRSRDLLPGWTSQPGMAGVRLTFSAGKENWLRDGTADWFWPAAEKAGVPVMLQPMDCFDEVARVAERHPALRLVIDHFGISRVVVARGQTAETIAKCAALAKYPNVFVKTSSAPTYSNEPWPFSDMEPHIRRIFDAFGPRRCFWGTDVSISFDKCSYRERVTHFTERLSFLSAGDRDWAMGRALNEFLGWSAGARAASTSPKPET